MCSVEELVLFVVLFVAASAKPQPTLAIVDAAGTRVVYGKSLSKAAVDFGDNPSLNMDSIVTGAELPLRIANTDGTADYFVIPVCVETEETNETALPLMLAECTAVYEDLDFTILVRFKNRWESFFSARVWQDAQWSPGLTKAWQTVYQNSSSVPLLPTPDASRSRREVQKGCNDLVDECFQARVFTYTRSYKDLGTSDVARIILPLAYTEKEMPWTLRLSHTLPEDAFALIELVAITSVPRFSNTIKTGLAILANVFAIAFVGSSLVALKFIGTKLSSGEGAADRRTGLYDGNDAVMRDRSFSGEAILICQHTWMTSVELLKRRRLVPAEDGGSELRALPSADEEEQDSRSSPDDVACRICQSAAPRDDLFAPCKCDGSCKYVHRACLETWRQTTTNAEHRQVCAECKTPYKLILSYGTASTAFAGLFSRVFKRALICFLVVIVAATSAYLLKFIFSLITLDRFVRWNALHLYHWCLGFTFMAAVSTHVTGLEFFIKDFPSYFTQQLPIILVSCVVYEILLGYAAQALLSVIFQSWITPEVSYGLGFIYTLTLAVFLGERLEGILRNQAQEIVAPR